MQGKGDGDGDGEHQRSPRHSAVFDGFHKMGLDIKYADASARSSADKQGVGNNELGAVCVPPR